MGAGGGGSGGSCIRGWEGSVCCLVSLLAACSDMIPKKIGLDDGVSPAPGPECLVSPLLSPFPAAGVALSVFDAIVMLGSCKERNVLRRRGR